MIQSDCNQTQYELYVNNSMSTNFAAAVIVRQKDNQLMNVYTYHVYDINNMPPPINTNKGGKTVSIAIGVTCAVIGVVLIALLIWWCVRW